MDRSVCAWIRLERDIAVPCIALRQFAHRPWTAAGSRTTRPRLADSRNRDWLGDISGSGRGPQGCRELPTASLVGVALGRSPVSVGRFDVWGIERDEPGSRWLVRLHQRLFWAISRIFVWMGSLLRRQHGFDRYSRRCIQ